MTFPFPTNRQVGLHKHSPGVTDSYNIEGDEYSPPKDQPGTPYMVCGWTHNYRKSSEPKLAGHDRVIVDIELYAPKSFPAGPHDLIDLPEGQFEVIGYPEDYSDTPFPPLNGWSVGGIVVNLRRVEG